MKTLVVLLVRFQGSQVLLNKGFGVEVGGVSLIGANQVSDAFGEGGEDGDGGVLADVLSNFNDVVEGTTEGTALEVDLELGRFAVADVGEGTAGDLGEKGILAGSFHFELFEGLQLEASQGEGGNFLH